MLKMSFSILLLGLSLTAFSGEKSLEKADFKTPVFSVSTEQNAEKGIQDFTLVNESGRSICNLYVSPSYQDNWGNDILQDDVLPSGQSALIRMNGYGDHCDFDVKIVSCANEKIVQRYNLCTLNRLIIQ